MVSENKFIVEPKKNKNVTILLAIDEDINNELLALSKKSKHSRNELINNALRFALDNLEYKEKQ